MASSNKLIATLGADVRDHEVVIIDFSDTVYMDDSAAVVVEQLIEIAVEENTECIAWGLQTSPWAASRRSTCCIKCRPTAS